MTNRAANAETLVPSGPILQKPLLYDGQSWRLKERVQTHLSNIGQCKRMALGLQRKSSLLSQLEQDYKMLNVPLSTEKLQLN